jgi:hypothetical protein
VKEPELEEVALRATSVGGRIEVTRRALATTFPQVTVPRFHSRRWSDIACATRPSPTRSRITSGLSSPSSSAPPWTAVR